MLCAVLARMRFVAVAACSAALVLAGCSLPTTGAPAAAPAAADPQAQLGRFYDQQLTWGPCVEFATSARDRESYGNPAFECARLEVPLDYAAPDGRTAQLGERTPGPSPNDE